MAKDIEGTEVLSGGRYRVPTGTNTKSEADRIVKDFMVRMATHTHSGKDSLPATLPVSIEKIFLNADIIYSLVGVANGEENGGTYKTSLLDLDNLSYDDNNLEYYYKLPSDTYWNRFFPTIERASSSAIYLYLLDYGYDIRVVG